MGGITALNKIQMGAETTGGTPVAADFIWRGGGIMKDERVIQHVAEQVGIGIPTTRNYIPKLGASLPMDPVEATFEQLPHILEAGVSIETATQDGAGTGYLYAYTTPTTAVNTLRYYTIEGGNNEHVREMEYSFVESFKIRGAAGEALMMEANWIGRQVTDTTFTGPLTVPTVEEILFSTCSFTIDDSGGTIGTTAVTGTLLGFELDVTTGWKAKYTADNKYFDFPYYDGTAFSATARFTYEHNSTMDTERDDYEAGAVRLIQLLWQGSALGTGATYDYKTLRINMSGFYTEFPHGDQDGNVTIEAVLQVGYNLADILETTGLDFLIVNELTALP